MLEKYKYPLWNFFYFFSIVSLIYLIFPFIHKREVLIEVENKPSPIIQTNSTTKVWKRGKHSSTVIVKEKKASTIIGEKERSSDKWVSITFKKSK